MQQENKELLFSVTKKDCRFDYYRGSGKGGQKRNKTSNCCRCTHIESGAVGKSEEGRSQDHNKRQAFRRMAESEKFQQWVRLRAAEVTGELEKIKKRVEKEVEDRTITVVEVVENGKWVELND